MAHAISPTLFTTTSHVPTRPSQPEPDGQHARHGRRRRPPTVVTHRPRRTNQLKIDPLPSAGLAIDILSMVEVVG